MTVSLEDVLLNKFGHSSFRPKQREAIESVLNKQDTLVMLPTGTGKSLCYQLPSYLLEGTTLIISPLLSLMQDQVENLRLKGEKRVVAINSLTSYSERNRIFKNTKQYKFIYTSPEMLQNKEFMAYLAKIDLSLFVVDEAHCISHWGTDFRPDYLALSRVRKQLNYPTTMALTATATAQVRQEIIRFLGLDIATTKQIIQSVDRSEIHFIVEQCTGNKLDIALQYVQAIKGAGIIYFTSKKMADETASLLRNQYSISAESYHSEKETDDKIRIQQQFLNNQLQVICATSAFGMGFDKKDIRYVIHFHIPDSPEMYLQEVGRASRDQQDGLAILLYQPGDEQIQKRFVEEALPTRGLLEAVWNKKITTSLYTDPIVKLAEYYLSTYKTVDKALKVILERKNYKNQQINYMVHYANVKSCKRNYLLHYFGEEKQVNEAFCCTYCNRDLSKIMDKMNNLTIEQDKISKSTDSWMKIFKALYNID